MDRTPNLRRAQPQPVHDQPGRTDLVFGNPTIGFCQVTHARKQGVHELLGNAGQLLALALEGMHAVSEAPIELVPNQQQDDQANDLSEEHMGTHRIASESLFPLRVLRAQAEGVIIAA